MDEIDKSKPRRSYVVTYSQADLQKFPSRESFGEAVAAAFTSKRSKVVPLHWACCLEKHENGGYHYHLALKLSGTKKWLEAKKSIEAEHGIAVNFSDHDGYYTAYRYISKSDEMVFHSWNWFSKNKALSTNIPKKALWEKVKCSWYGSCYHVQEKEKTFKFGSGRVHCQTWN